jgi:hypothetical protein
MKTHRPALIKPLTTIAALAVLLATGCATDNTEAVRHRNNLADIHRKCDCKIKTLRKWWAPLPGVDERKDVPFEHVKFLDKEPTDRQFQIIGYFEPNWQVMSEYVQAARGEAALQGADAYYFIDREKNPTMPRHSAAIIVWK